MSDEDQASARRSAWQLLNLKNDALVVGNAGWLIPRKRFDVFLQVAAKVHKACPEAIFVICGGGPEEETLRQMAGELGSAGSVNFEGWVQNLEPYYQAFDVLLFNSNYDAFGLTALEAANHGAIIVASVRCGGLRKFIKHEANGFLFERHDVDAMASIICGLASGADSARLRCRAMETIRHEFDIAASATQYKRLFSEILSDRRDDLMMKQDVPLVVWPYGVAAVNGWWTGLRNRLSLPRKRHVDALRSQQ